MELNRKKFKKGAAMRLACAMVAGLVTAMPDNTIHVKAAGSEPSVFAYATKTQMMDSTFAPNSDGTATNIGKLVFGKNSSGKPQKWYILGKDTGVSGDNTIIFAESEIISSMQKFDSNEDGNKSFNSSFGVYVNNPTEVYRNHYGASDLRGILQAMADGSATTYFTSAEQGLMNATTVTTNDTKNSVTYTTTDKLYALALEGTFSAAHTIKAGSGNNGNNTILARDSYWKTGSKFWLRSPRDSDDGMAVSAQTGNISWFFVGNGVYNDNYVRPASNLNLSSVLFASAATAASSGTTSSTITSVTAMTLRLDGSSKNIGTVTYNTTPGEIKATKGSTAGNVALVVQGNDGTSDWYYSKTITGTENVNVSVIESEANTPASIDLSTCKIWLETTDSTENLTYAVEATAAATSITTQPGNATVREGETATFTIAASGTALTYQWMINRNDGNGWVNIENANAASYTTSTVDKSFSGFQYKCVVSNSTGSVESSTATLTVQDAGGSNPGSGGADNPGDSGSDDSNTPSNSAVTYEILNGANSSWTAGSSEELTIRGAGEFSKFTGVKVDGNLIDQSNYTAKEGSTIISLKASYLNALGAGSHTAEILWTDGSASTAFAINASTSGKKDNVPKTGDNTPIAWLFILAGLSGAGLVLTGRKGRKNLETLRK